MAIGGPDHESAAKRHCGIDRRGTMERRSTAASRSRKSLWEGAEGWRTATRLLGACQLGPLSGRPARGQVRYCPLFQQIVRRRIRNEYPLGGGMGIPF